MKKSKNQELGKLTLYILIVLVLLSFIIRLYFITKYQLIYGDDGAYYLINTNALLNGNFHTPSLIFYYFAFFSIIFNDLTLGIKVGASLLSALTIIPIYLLATYFTKDERIGIFAALLGTFSAINLLIMSVTLKEVGGILIGLFFVYYILKILDEKNKRLTLKQTATITFLFFMMVLTHISSSLYFLLILSSFSFYKTITCHKNQNCSYKDIFILLLVLVLVLSLTYQILVTDLISQLKSSWIDLNFQKGINLKLFDSYTFLVPLSLVFLFAIITKKIKTPNPVPHISLLVIWFMAGMLLTQNALIDKWWVPRFDQMNYTVMILICSIGFYYSLNYRKEFASVFILLAGLTILLESVLLGIAGTQYSKPNITMEEYNFFQDMKSKLPENTIVILDYEKYYNTNIVWWLKWMNYSTSENGQINPEDNPLLLVENTSKFYSKMLPEEIIGKSEGGKFEFVYPSDNTSGAIK